MAVVAIAIADHEVATGLGLQHEAEVLCTHGRLERMDVCRTNEFMQHVLQEGGLHGMVGSRRAVALEFHVAARAVGGTDVLHQLSHPRLDKVARLYREAAHRPAQLAAVGQHVQRVSGVYLGDRQHHRLGWFDIARHDGLQRRADLEGDLDGVDALIRHRRVRALAMHVDGELVA